ncbi:hypothetical protein WDU94_004017, partial [Cyamophila willieti]
MVISRRGFYPPAVDQTNQLLTLTSPSLSGVGKSSITACMITGGVVARLSTIH